MAVLHRARACIIGNDATMHAMLRRMLLNCAYFDEYDIPETLEMLKEQVQLHAKEDGGTGVHRSSQISTANVASPRWNNWFGVIGTSSCSAYRIRMAASPRKSAPPENQRDS